MSVLAWSALALILLTLSFACDEACARGFGMAWGRMSYAALAAGGFCTLMAVSVAL